MSEKMKEIVSNADWVLFRKPDGSIIAESRKDKTVRSLSAESIKEMKSLIALLEGGNIKIE